MPLSISTLVHPQEWFHECNLQQTTATEPLIVDLNKEYCVSQDSTPIKSIMRTEDILAFFVHAPWVKTNYELLDWNKDSMQVEALKIAHIRNDVQGMDCRLRPLLAVMYL